MERIQKTCKEDTRHRGIKGMSRIHKTNRKYTRQTENTQDMQRIQKTLRGNKRHSENTQGMERKQKAWKENGKTW